MSKESITDDFKKKVHSTLVASTSDDDEKITIAYFSKMFK